MNTAPKGYTPRPDRRGDVDYHRELTGKASDLIEALAVLPPETKIEVGSSDYDGGVTEAGGIWYYPAEAEAFIG